MNWSSTKLQTCPHCDKYVAIEMYWFEKLYLRVWWYTYKACLYCGISWPVEKIVLGTQGHMMAKTPQISPVEQDFKDGSVECEPYFKTASEIYKSLPSDFSRAHLLVALSTVVAILLGDEDKDWRDEWVARFARITQYQVDKIPAKLLDMAAKV